MLDRKQIQAVFLFEFKMGHKAAETTHNIKNSFGPETANEHTVQWWFKFCKDEHLEVRNVVTVHTKLTTNQEQSSKLICLQLYRKLLQNSISTILWSFGI